MVYSPVVESLPARLSGDAISPRAVRYIKLGEGGQWEQACLDDGTMCVDFWTASPERFAWCQAGNWPALAASYRADGKDPPGPPRGLRTRCVSSARTMDPRCESRSSGSPCTGASLRPGPRRVAQTGPGSPARYGAGGGGRTGLARC